MAVNTTDLNRSIKDIESWIKDINESGKGTPPDNFRDAIIWSSPEYGSLTFWGDTIENYREHLGSLYRAINGKKSEYLSAREIEKTIQEVTLQTLDSRGKFPNTSFDQRLQNNINILRNRLTASPSEWDIYMGVEGIATNNSCLSFGKVHLLPGEKSTLRYLRREVGNIVWTSANSTEEKKGFLKNNRKILDNHYKGKAVAHIQVRAVDQEAAKALALKELKLTLDVLNFYTIFIHPRGTRTRAYLPGEAHFRAHNLTLPFTGTAGNKHVGLSMGIGGPMDLFQVGDLNGQKSLKFGLKEASRILALPKRNDLQERFVAALRFAGRAMVNETREESFLGFAIALESLLGDRNSQGEINYKLGARCAHLLGQTVQERKDIRNKLKILYGVRSQIVHRGNIDLTDLQLGEIRGFARSALVAVLTDKGIYDLKNEEAFLDWFEDKIFG